VLPRQRNRTKVISLLLKLSIHRIYILAYINHNDIHDWYSYCFLDSNKNHASFDQIVVLNMFKYSTRTRIILYLIGYEIFTPLFPIEANGNYSLYDGDTLATAKSTFSGFFGGKSVFVAFCFIRGQ